MPVFRLCDEPLFPPAHLASDEGLLAVGGDLEPDRLLLAYSMGVFPWYGPGDPILWWSPDPRCVIFPEQLHRSRSLQKRLRRAPFEIRVNSAFAEVVRACAEVPRPGQDGTWITPEMEAAYLRLHDEGYAHSLECWKGEQLVGGIYGVALGRFFFGESMFSRETDASKVALVTLVERMEAEGGGLLDCQMPTDHLMSLGAKNIPRGRFLSLLTEGGISPSTSPKPSDFLFLCP